MSFRNDFSRWWAVHKPIPEGTLIDLIALVSFGATEYRLTYGSKNVTEIGLRLSRDYPEAKVISGEFTGNSLPNMEFSMKKNILLPRDVYRAGRVISTIKETLAWRAVFSKNFNPRSMIIVTDEMHSRSARRASNRVWNGIWYKRLWKRVTRQPTVKIYVLTFPSSDNIDPQNPMEYLRSLDTWMSINILRELFLMLCPFGYTIMREFDFHQPIAK
jgi:hypothetical protein